MLNNFYKTEDLQQQANSLMCRIAYNAAHPVFKGHFPGNPVVPGVCTMAIVKELLEKVLDKKMGLKEASLVKFLGLINPSMSPQLSLSWKEEGGLTVATASLREGNSALFKMTGNYIPAIP